MTIDETKQAIRRELKEKGYNSRQIGVISKSYSAIYLIIKDKIVNIDDVNNLAHKYECYSHCPYSGEILSGGNTFIFVRKDFI